jgi:hypothetical protein
MGGTRAQKADYFEKLRGLLTEYKSLFLVGYSISYMELTLIVLTMSDQTRCIKFVRRSVVMLSSFSEKTP